MHELGHCLAARKVGATVDGILLWPLGGLAYVAHDGDPSSDLQIALAGPLTHGPQAVAWVRIGGKRGRRGRELVCLVPTVAADPRPLCARPLFSLSPPPPPTFWVVLLQAILYGFSMAVSSPACLYVCASALWMQARARNKTQPHNRARNNATETAAPPHHPPTAPSTSLPLSPPASTFPPSPAPFPNSRRTSSHHP